MSSPSRQKGTVAEIVGIDLSLTATGFAARVGTVTLNGTLKPKRAGIPRLAEMQELVFDLWLHGRPPDLVVLEGYSFGTARQQSHAHALGELGGVIRLALWHNEIPFVDVTPASLKKYATGKGNASKDQVLVAAVKRSGIEFANNNEADAAWLRWMACDHYGFPEFDMPALNRTALVAVRWPSIEVHDLAEAGR